MMAKARAPPAALLVLVFAAGAMAAPLVPTSKDQLVSGPDICPLRIYLVPQGTESKTWAATVREARGEFETDDLYLQARALASDSEGSLGGVEADIDLVQGRLDELVAEGGVVFQDSGQSGILDAGDVIGLPSHLPTERLALAVHNSNGSLIGLTGACA